MLFWQRLKLLLATKNNIKKEKERFRAFFFISTTWDISDRKYVVLTKFLSRIFFTLKLKTLYLLVKVIRSKAHTIHIDIICLEAYTEQSQDEQNTCPEAEPLVNLNHRYS